MKMKFWIVLAGFALAFTSCETEDNQFYSNANQLHSWNKVLEEAIINDFFSPPVASRCYAYPNIASYLVLSQGTQQSINFANITQGLPTITKPENNLDLNVSAHYAFYYVAKEMVYSIDTLDAFSNTFFQEGTYHAEKAYGMQVAQQVLGWAATDGYKESRSAEEFVYTDSMHTWKPTPPDYLPALEPTWGELRSFTLATNSMFRPAPPTPVSLDTQSTFYQELKEVQKAVYINTSETQSIAKFWDCNPLVRMHQGHVTFAEKKLTPGGHWLNIARNAMIHDSLSLIESAEVYTLTSIAIADAFISCWDAKYFYNYVRPVTFINEHIDPEWSPILYTPNFPEYPSGHSVVSGAASEILAAQFGANHAFTDSSEYRFGMDPRSFNSFYEASEEAAISRMHGGIHFRPAIEDGVTQGRNIGKYILERAANKQ